MRTRDEIVRLDKAHVWHPYTAMDEYIAHTDPLVVAEAQGSFLVDVNGRRYLDANGSWWVSTLGHRHPRLVAALKKQVDLLPHSALAGCTHATAAELAASLAEMAPSAPSAKDASPLSKVFFVDNGSGAVEVALKAAAQYWAQNGRPQRTRFISLQGAFHGDTMGATSVGGIAVFRQVFGPLLFDVVHAPFPAEDGAERAFEAILTLLRQGKDTVAGVVLEPLLQGASGMRMFAPKYLRAVRQATRDVDTFLIADEVFTGFGRTGTVFACEQADVVPDMLCLAKALSGGLLPFGATLMNERIFAGFGGGKDRALLYGHSYCGNPLGAAVAQEVLRVYRDERVLEGVQSRAARIAEAVGRWAKIPGVGRPRALGMVGAVDLGQEGYLSDAGWRVYEHAKALGLYLRPLGDTIYVAPALNIPIADLEVLLTGVEAALNAALNSSKQPAH